MDNHHIVACEFLASLIRNQPELLKGFIPNKDSGQMVAGFCTGFIERFSATLKDFDEGSKESTLDDWSFLTIKAER
ncbi:MAG: hypothetical protein EG825_10570 [Rhodocyclaceae bacterium]|nr:hypothetical protein [Rhodocyclaceae bacterium]